MLLSFTVQHKVDDIHRINRELTCKQIVIDSLPKTLIIKTEDHVSFVSQSLIFGHCTLGDHVNVNDLS